MPQFLRRLKTIIKDSLIPAIPDKFAGGVAFAAYARHKSVLNAGKLICPLIDPIIFSITAEKFTCVLLGDLDGAEEIPSTKIKLQIQWIPFLASVFCLRLSDFKDYMFLRSLYTNQLCSPFRFREIYAIRSFLIANYFSLRFRSLASQCESANVVVYYNPAMLGVVRAFRLAGKEVWDIQHGYLGINHDAYNNVSAFNIQSSFKPTGFVVWEERFGNYLNSTFRLPYKSTNYAHLRHLQNQSPPQKQAKTVLYTLQWGTPIPPEVINAVVELRTVYWIFRLHPMESSERDDLDPIRDLENAVITGAEEPLSAALTRCDLHVTYNSSVVHEAAAMNIFSCFIDPSMSIRFSHEISNNQALLTSPENLQKIIRERLLQ